MMDLTVDFVRKDMQCLPYVIVSVELQLWMR